MPAGTATAPPAAYSPKAFEQAYEIGHTKLYEEIKAGRLIVRKLGKRTIILTEDAVAWARSLPIAKPGEVSP
jgi:hypothetical protein